MWPFSGDQSENKTVPSKTAFTASFLEAIISIPLCPVFKLNRIDDNDSCSSRSSNTDIYNEDPNNSDEYDQGDEGWDEYDL